MPAVENKIKFHPGWKPFGVNTGFEASVSPLVGRSKPIYCYV